MDQDALATDPVALNTQTLADLPAEVLRPGYDRAALRAGIVHIGLGNFHRAHQAWYLHRLMQAAQAQDWAILGASVRAADTAQRARLLAQDCLTTLIELGPEPGPAEVTGAMIGYLPIEPDNASLIQAMSDPAIRIVSLTVTEGGYYTDPATGGFDASHPDIQHDVTHPKTPRTAFGAMLAALRNRRAAGQGPFTAMSCDNLQGNGAVLRRTLVGLARLSDPDLADWLAQHGAFPNSMVDCIVPATGPAEIAAARARGIADTAPVTHENFRQWVIEDHFCAGRPAWEQVGATLTDDVHAYETMKIRVLNAGHQVLANAGEILGLATIGDCMADPEVLAFFRAVQRRGILPHVASVPGRTPEAYLALIEQRFANPAIADTVRRVAFDGSSRHPGFVLPMVREALAAGEDIEGLALVEALWCRMCTGLRADGSVIAANDPQWDSLHDVAQTAAKTPQAWLAQGALYGDLAGAAPFAEAFTRWRIKLETEGCRACLRAFVAQSS